MGYLIWVGVFLAICTYTDVKNGYIYTGVCVVNIFAALVVHLMESAFDWSNVAVGAAVGILVMIIAILSKEKIGKGDAWVISTLGVILGGTTTTSVLFWASLLGCIYSVVGIMIGRIKAKDKMVFMPFVFAGTVVTGLLGGINV